MTSKKNFRLVVTLFVISVFSITCSIIAADRNISFFANKIQVFSSSVNGMMSETIQVIPRDTIFSTGLFIIPTFFLILSLFFLTRFMVITKRSRQRIE